MLPGELIVSRRGHVLQRLPGHPFIWDWFFWDDQSVAMLSGPLHSGFECDLLDIHSGKLIAGYNCYDDPPDHPPGWVQQLLNENSSASSPCD